ncbi:hypothetical protein NKH18_07965 [Streptomyces sp. M10(2022)]
MGNVAAKKEMKSGEARSRSGTELPSEQLRPWPHPSGVRTVRGPPEILSTA